MPSISRYLATVRRAIWMPDAFSSISTIAWSESGFCLSSSSMIFLIDCFTLSDAMSSSATRRIDELKKYFSSNSPCGVCTYLLVVTREMVLSCMPTWSAMSRKIIGFRNMGPFSKKSRCRSTIDSVTRMIVLRRCSIARINH